MTIDYEVKDSKFKRPPGRGCLTCAWRSQCSSYRGIKSQKKYASCINEKTGLKCSNWSLSVKSRRELFPEKDKGPDIRWRLGRDHFFIRMYRDSFEKLQTYYHCEAVFEKMYRRKGNGKYAES